MSEETDKRNISNLGQEDCLASDNQPMKKKQKCTEKTNKCSNTASISDGYVRQDFKDRIMTAFKNGLEETDGNTGAAVLNYPFTCCVLPNFVKDAMFLDGLKEELLDLDFNKKSNDLYQFEQSEALQNFTSPHIMALRKLLYQDFLSWLRDIRGIPFTDTIDMTCSKYNYTDVLLCHDDELEGRRIAFILYLVPPWMKEDGGLLDLFDLDEHGQPQSIVKSLVPKWNNLVFFEVTPKSFHQVSEVLTQDKCRLSISGWFHGPTVPRTVPYVEPRNTLCPHIDVEESVFCNWISESYLDLVNQSEVQDTFSDESEIQLAAFFDTDKFSEVLTALQSSDIRWMHQGPANKRRYESADPTSLPPVVQECLSVMRSEHAFLLLSNFTALKLHEQAPCDDDDDDDDDVDDDGVNHKRDGEDVASGGDGGDHKGENAEEATRAHPGESSQSCVNEDVGTCEDRENGVVIKCNRKPSNPRCRAEVRRWTHGCYTLLHDTDTEGSEFALDASVFFNTKGLKPDCGGFVSYIAKEEDEELLSVLPEDNSLSLVYRDKDTLRFVKHVNQSFTKSRGGDDNTGHSQPAFYELYLVYYE